MTKHRRSLTALTLIALAPLALAAGSGGGTPAEKPSAAPGASGSLEAVCAAAADESSEAIWYESSLPEQIDEVIAAFQETYPDVDVVHQRITGGSGIGGLVVQERQSGGRTADLVTASPSIVSELDERGYLTTLDADDLGITDEKLMPADTVVATTTSVPVLIYNTERVDESDLAGGWEDFTDEKWKGQALVWNRSGTNFINLVPAWGEDDTRAYIEELVANEPKLNESTFDIAQQIGAGTSVLGFGMYHTTYEVQETGAPIEMIVLDPLPASQLYSSVISDSPAAMSAQCFLGWLVTDEGAQAYENATYRGNHLIASTKTAELVKDLETTVLPYSEVDKGEELTTEFNQILAQ